MEAAPLYPNLAYEIEGEYIASVMEKKVSAINQRRFRALMREIRTGAGLRQVDLAERLGQPQSFVSKYESGERRLDLLEVRRICEAVGITLEEFVRKLEDSLK